jgi:tRNA 2-thiouridine synthesizing protein A
MSGRKANEAMAQDIDLSGLKCPLPVLRMRKVLQRAVVGDRYRLICTDPLTAIDIPNLLRETGDVLEDHCNHEGKLVFLIRCAKAGMQRGPASTGPREQSHEKSRE